MSGVTVAQISRSMSPGLHARVREGRPRRRQRDIGERLVGRGDPTLADPGALADPLVGGVDVRGQVVVRHHPLGHVHAEAGDPDRAAAGGADHRSTANVNVPRAASSAPTWAVALPRPIGPRIVSISHVSVRTSPGSTIRLKRQSSMPAKKAILPRFASSDEHGHRAGLRHRLDDEDAGHDGAAREVAREPPVVGADEACRDHLAARLELDHLVEQEERVAVREDRLDPVPSERE